MELKLTQKINVTLYFLCNKHIKKSLTVAYTLNTKYIYKLGTTNQQNPLGIFITK
jgi:hypothetical protein